jgi:transcriptional regulator with XRE-family HTH domain
MKRGICGVSTTEGGMTDEDREVAAVVRRMRRKSGMSQRRFADAAGMSQSRISLYESGEKRPTRSSLERMAAVAGEPLDRFWDELRLLPPALTAAGEALEAAEAESAAEPGAEDRLARAALAAVRAELAKGIAALGLRDDSLLAGPAADGEAEAEAAWIQLAALPAERRRELVESEPRYQTPELCARICRASLERTSSDLDDALELAQLAVRIAYLLPGDDELRWEAEGHAWAHVGNARRVANDPKRAAAAFAKSRELRPAGNQPASGYFDEGRALDLEASLQRSQRKFDEALALHDRALAVSCAEHLPYVLLNKAFTLEQAGKYEDALGTLAEANRYTDAHTPPRLVFGMRFNEATNLCHLDRHAEAAALLPVVRELADPDSVLDLIRTRWLEGRVALGFGEREEAAAAFEEVRNAFAGRKLPYDMALATLDLAALYLEDGRTRDVKALAKEMVAIFLAQGVHREAIAAARLFARAVAAETATAELARNLARYLQWAQHDPALRFEG